jgi:hypothetical protein
VIGASGVVGRRVSRRCLRGPWGRYLARPLSEVADFANVDCEVEQRDIQTSLVALRSEGDRIPLRHYPHAWQRDSKTCDVATARRSYDVVPPATPRRKPMSVKPIYAANASALGVRINRASTKVAETGRAPPRPAAALAGQQAYQVCRYSNAVRSNLAVKFGLIET